MSILTEVPQDAHVLDLGAARAARAEVRASRGEGRLFLKLDQGYVEVKAEFALTVAFAFQAEDIRGGLEGLLVDPTDVDVLLSDGLSALDLEEITKLIAGKPLGESSASPTP